MIAAVVREVDPPLMSLPEDCAPLGATAEAWARVQDAERLVVRLSRIRSGIPDGGDTEAADAALRMARQQFRDACEAYRLARRLTR